MAKLHAALALPNGCLLARLSASEFQRLSPRLKLVSLDFNAVLYEPRALVDYVYFPLSGVVSAVALMLDGTAIEVATIGHEGMVSIGAFIGVESSADRMVVQVPGEALRMATTDLQSETRSDSPLRRLLIRYHGAFLKQISQAVACNGLHPIQQRCCKWILMTRDRVNADEFPLTQEFLSHMLGVRRASVTEVLRPLQDANLIRNWRGNVTVLDRKNLEAAACECYRITKEEFDRI
ncbi:MAG TPA: Crp/Fnr family transcriptional regulator [Gemmataceae bacterium]|jgi:CRP-like cAMP-binding protein|nr:Crp/Fnr family transcriptional regulator [Gemmataceae bacterium]